MSSKKLLGTVESDKMQKTVVVKVTVLKTHPKYHKQYAVAKRYQAHDEKREYHVGDYVEIAEARSRSKEKHWRVIRKLK